MVLGREVTWSYFHFQRIVLAPGSYVEKQTITGTGQKQEETVESFFQQSEGDVNLDQADHNGGGKKWKTLDKVNRIYQWVGCGYEKKSYGRAIRKMTSQFTEMRKNSKWMVG